MKKQQRKAIAIIKTELTLQQKGIRAFNPTQCLLRRRQAAVAVPQPVEAVTAITIPTIMAATIRDRAVMQINPAQL